MFVSFLLDNILRLAETYNASENRGRDFFFALHQHNDTSCVHWAKILGLPFNPATHVPLSVEEYLQAALAAARDRHADSLTVAAGEEE